MAIADDFTIDTTNKTIKHSSGATVYSVNAFYTYLLEYFDDEATIKYEIPISAQTPTEYTLINGWFINDESFKYLRGGAISTSGWNGEVYDLYFAESGYTSCVGGDLTKVVTDGGTHTGVLLDYDNTLRKWWVRKVVGTFANSDVLTITSGTGAGTVLANEGVVTGEGQFSNVFTLGSLVSGTTLDVYQKDIQIVPWWSSGHIDILVKVKEAGVEIDGSYVTVMARKYGTLYDHYEVDAGSGRNPVPLAAFSDRNNTTSDVTVAGYNDIVVSFGSVSQDLGNGNGSRPYDCTVNGAGRTVQQIYEYLKYVTRTGSTTSLNGVDGEYYVGVGDIRFEYDAETDGPFDEEERINGTGGVYGYLVSLIDDGTTGTMVLRNVHGVFTDDMAITGVTSGATAVVNGAVEDITASKQAPFGTFAGGKFFGARGVFLTNMAGSDANKYSLVDATGTAQDPPATIAITVTGVESGDRVSVFRLDANGAVDKSVYSSHVSSNTLGSGSFVVTTSIESDTPSTGLLRVVDRDGNGNVIVEHSYSYTSWSGSTFTLSGTLSQNYDGDDTAFVPYIDTVADATSESVSITYVTDRNVVTRVRKKGIVPFTVTGQVVSTGLTVTAIRTADSIVG